MGGQIRQEVHLDGGASCCLVSTTFCDRLLQRNLARKVGDFSTSLVVEAADGHRLEVTHDVEISFVVGKAKIRWRFLAVRGLANPMVLGLDFYMRAPAKVDYEACTLILSSYNVSVPIKVHNFELNSDNVPDSELFPSSAVTISPKSTRVVSLSCAPYDPLLTATRKGFVKSGNFHQNSFLRVEPCYREIVRGRLTASLTNVTDRPFLLCVEQPVAIFGSREQSPRMERVCRAEISATVLDSVMNRNEKVLDDLTADFDCFSRQHAAATTVATETRAVVSDRTRARRAAKFKRVAEEVRRYDQKFESLNVLSHRPRFSGPEAGLETLGSDQWAEQMDPEEARAFRPVFVCSRDSNVRVPSRWALSREGREQVPAAGVVDTELQVVLGEALTKHEKIRVLELLAKFPEVFQRPPGKWIPSKLDPFVIDTGDERPVFQQYRAVPVHLRPYEAKEVKFLLEKGIIRKSNSRWQSRWLMVPKPDGRYRCCLDARALNKKTRVRVAQLPLINDLLDSLQGKKFWSQLDLEMGFSQIVLSEDSIGRTSFACSLGKYEYVYLPFGVQAAPGFFQEQMEKALEGLPNVRLFIDDILIASETLEQHFKDIEAVFERLHRYGLVAKIKKCTFLLSKITFLGHDISREGVAVSSTKVDAVTKIDTPKTAKQLLQALGLLGWFRRFIYQYGALAAPLYRLTSKDVEYEWTPECEKSFSELKRRLVSAPVLKMPDFNGAEFLLQVDASDYGIGGVLLQENSEGVLQPICFVSTKLGKHAEAWHVREREAYAICWSIIKLRYYLIGRHFTVETDHQSLASLSWVLNQTSCNRLTRWSLLLSAYNFSVRAIKGVTNIISDRLSRLPNSLPVSHAVYSVTIAPMADPVFRLSPSLDESCQLRSKISLPGKCGYTPSNPILRACAVAPAEEEKEEELNALDPLPLPSLDEMVAEQRRDPLFSQFLRRFQGLEADEPELDRLLSEAKKNKGEYTVLQPSGAIVYSSPKYQGTRIVVPPKLRLSVFMHFHDLVCHAALKRTYSIAASRVYWLGMWDDFKEWHKRCFTCQHNKAPRRRRQGYLILFPATYPLQLVASDILGPFPISVTGAKYVLVVVDKFTRFCWLIPIPDQTAETVADALWTHVFSVFSFPETFLSDNGPCYRSRLLERFLSRSLGNSKLIKHTSAFHAATDGQCERLNRYTTAAMRIYTEQHAHSDWCQFLPSIAFSYRIAVMGAVGAAPHTLMFLRQANLPTDILYGPKSEIEKDKKEYLLQQTARMRTAYELALSVQEKSDSVKKSYYDSKQLGTEYEVGDLVWLFTPTVKEGLSKKLTRKNSGPFEVVKKHSPVSYTLQVSPDETQRVHIQRMIPCYFDPEKRPQRFQNLVPVAEAAPEEHEMQPLPPIIPDAVPAAQQLPPKFAILRKRFQRDTNEKQYLVQSGLDQKWHSASSLKNDAKWSKLIADFEKSARHNRRRRRTNP